MSAVNASPRGQYDGVLQVVRYNWPYYVAAVLGGAAITAMVLLLRLPSLTSWLLIAGATAAVFWLAISLAVSHYVYDRSELYRWQWIRERVMEDPRHVVNIHAGLDETSVALQEIFPTAEVTILDIYDDEEMPEPSIARARRDTRGALASVSADFRALPLEPESADLVTLIFVAHELRRREAKEALFREIARILKPGGRLLIVEHPRDTWNFLAFGPGAFHFFPRTEWLRVAETGGLRMDQQFGRTAFVQAFVFRREDCRRT